MGTIAQNQPNSNANPHAVQHTDVGNARLFARRYDEALGFCQPWNKWLYWDGGRWKVDDCCRVQEYAKRTALALYDDARGEADDAIRQAKFKHALRSQGAARIDALIKLARDDMPIQVEELDAEPMLLNVANATLDLRHQEEYEPRWTDFLTTQAPVHFDPAAHCPLWLQFLDTIFAGNAELIDFIQELAGYCLTGDVREQILPIFWGDGANGKSTFVNTLLAVLGPDYAIPGPRDLLMVRKPDSHQTNVACLHGKRLVVWQESAEGNRLDEALVKELTGGDRLTARRMREDPWSFAPTHKAILVTNHRPEVRGTDHGLWRRLRLVPFNVKIPDDQQDRQLGGKLQKELPGILNWCLEGCRRWQAQGLSLPAEVRAATAEFRDQQDTTGQFLQECCLTGSDFRERLSKLFTAWGEWCKRTGEHEGTQRRFGQAIKRRGFPSYKNSDTWYRGLTIRPDFQPQGEAEDTIPE